MWKQAEHPVSLTQISKLHTKHDLTVILHQVTLLLPPFLQVDKLHCASTAEPACEYMHPP